VRGVLRLDCRIIAFHFQGAVFESVRKAMIRGHSLPKLISSPYRADKPGLFRVPITEHVQEFYVSIYLDTSAAIYDGPARFETDASIKVPTGTTWRMHNVRLQFGVYLANGGGRLLKSFGGGAAVEGWISTTETEGSPFGYLRLSVPAVRRFASEPIEEVTITGSGRPGHDTRLMSFLNPDLHKHPPSYGLVQYPETLPPMRVTTHQQTAVVTFQEPWLVVGDRLFFRWADTTPDPGSGIDGAGAVLLAVTLGRD
jgi:hypothetical protein